ncbi:unnamed protein product [Somion occarium]|uniref:Transmembrane protein n=1 Tax=Somion occarium TaxID=3059160 RepID=A0ABP1DU86_9APHY
MASVLLLRQRPPLRLSYLLQACSVRPTLLISSRLLYENGCIRGFHSTVLRQNSNGTKPSPSEPAVTKGPQPLPQKQLEHHTEAQVYHGPLTNTFRRLKLFSLSSLTLCFLFTPVLFMIETTSAVPLVARFALAGVALTTSGVSTALVGWCGKPYVSTLRWLPADPLTLQDGTKGPEIVEMTTLTLSLKERITRVYDTAFLVPTNRPFAKWELAEVFKLAPAEIEAEKEEKVLPREETVAETMDKKGNVLGRWVVHWDENGVGTCREHGQVTRYFNVHEELLPQPIR